MTTEPMAGVKTTNAKVRLRISNQRLLLLAKFLATRRRVQNHFDMNYWVGHYWKGAADLSCGTTACALGWATTIPAFRRLGLRMNPPNVYGHNTTGYPVLLGKDPDCEGFSAAMRLFGLWSDEAEQLFGPRQGTAREVAQRIRDFVARRQ